ncbi:uncharacterized protein [Spinacia oleracea]|uniref:Retrotransposon Copia-like N-terminal domain-containing protein n=1 Tax=Spinacia oleracea TaxID=3562 RepID=A0ABM3QHN2_SPIOL|nr:uncharacterized protein LOC130459487 [Spinacia oleracea]
MDNDGKIDPASPYYLSSGDQPGLIITHVLLRGGINYMAWARAMQLSLQSRRKFVFVDGTITQPMEKKKQLDWVTVNSMLVSWMLKGMEPKIATSIPYHDNAKKLWDYLAKKYGIANGPRLQQLRGEIVACKQVKGMTIEEYYTTLTGLYDDLVQFKPLRSCECGNCSCNMVGKLQEDRDEEILHQFLIGVDDDLYATVRTNLLSRTPLPTLDEAYLAFEQEERSRGIALSNAAKEQVHTQSIFALQAEQRPKARYERSDKSQLNCTRCKRNGHDNSTCFKLHGYPEWYDEMKQRRAKAGSSTGGVVPVTAARSRGGIPARANAISTTNVGESNALGVTESGNVTTFADYTPEQVRTIINMLNSTSLNNKNSNNNNAQLDKMTGPTFGEPDWSR